MSGGQVLIALSEPREMWKDSALLTIRFWGVFILLGRLYMMHNLKSHLFRQMRFPKHIGTRSFRRQGLTDAELERRFASPHGGAASDRVPGGSVRFRDALRSMEQSFGGVLEVSWDGFYLNYCN